MAVIFTVGKFFLLKMQQLNYVGDRKFAWFDVPEPKLTRSDQVIGKPIVMGRCDADVTAWLPGISTVLAAGNHQRVVDPMVNLSLGETPYRTPFPIGHESVCEIVAVGSEVSLFTVGDRAVVPWSISCGKCANCRRKLTTHCQNSGDTLISGWGFGAAMGPWGGMITDYIRVPFADHMLTKIPSDVDPLMFASASDNLADAWRTVAPELKRNPEQGVCVLGGGAKSIGIYAAALAVALGSPNVVYLDFDQKRLDIASAYGAHAIEIPKKLDQLEVDLAELGEFHIGVEAASSIAGFNFLFDHIACGGTVFGIGFYFFSEQPINYFTMYGKSLTLKIGISHPATDLEDIVSFVLENNFDPRLVQTHVFDYYEADKVYGKASTKLVLVRD
ncbi:zinc-dependent alcohol dehydrogenase [Vacuolonema iberomarrocanum]|uniref:zinc-dependent alcohol dehydrogenase n=1 Tax=Vacuolonema iberomarrocanum TaxID=3454632 RepID=UPI0019FF85C1|nr:alcohol dehydrogenase catalytic domain-containing protein [filamentous cyanobacterium LEGE 07170]